MKRKTDQTSKIYIIAKSFFMLICCAGINAIITADLSGCFTPPVYASETCESRLESASATVNTDGNTANVIVYVNFSDTTHSHYDSLWGKCFLENPNIEELFNGRNSHPKAMRQYIYNITYGAVQVANIFPQYNQESGLIEPFTLPQSASYYADNSQRDTLVSDTVSALNASGLLSQNINIDRNNDGIVDNLMILLPCENNNSNTLFTGLYTSHIGTSYLNGKRVIGYNIIPESGAYLSNGQSGLLIHEYMHSLGYRDLYRNRGNATSNDNPVSIWDIMSSQSTYLQYPLAYNRYATSKLFDIPVVTSSQSGYSIYSAALATPFSSGTENSRISDSIKNNQAVIIKTPYSDTEFFVVEYRKKASSTWVSDGMNPMVQVETGYDYKIYDSGLIIYRVNLATQAPSNFTYDPYYIYVFRPGDTYYASGIEKAGGEITKSFLSAESGRTSYGQADFSKGLSDGALTYSDGHNSGIVISNVGSAAGDSISFDITIPDFESMNLWTTAAMGEINYDNISVLSALNSDGNIYLLPSTNYGGSLYTLNTNLSEDGSEVAGSAIQGSFFGWKMVTYNGVPYVGYNDLSQYKAHLAKWNGTSWQELWSSSYDTGSGSLCADTTGVYMTFTDSACQTVSCIKYDGSKVTSLGSVATTNNYAANIDIAAQNGVPYIFYQEFFNNSKAVVRKYNGNGWENAGELNMSASSVSMAVDGDSLYLARILSEQAGNTVDMWKYEIGDNSDSSSASAWTQVGSGAITDNSSTVINLFVQKGVPLVAINNSDQTCLQIYTLKDDCWTQVGQNAASENVSALQVYAVNGRAFICYQSASMHKTVIKSIAFDFPGSPENHGSQITPKVSWTNLSLGGEIGLKIYAKLPQNFDHAILNSENGADIEISRSDSRYDEGDENEYVFTYFVAAKEMNDLVSLAVYDSEDNLIPLANEGLADGIYYYSVMDYLNSVTAPENGYDISNPDLYALCCAMKKYGENAQIYFEYNLEALGLGDVSDGASGDVSGSASDNVSDISGYVPDLSGYASVTSGSEPSGVHYVGSSLLLKSETCIRHYFLIDDTELAAKTLFKINSERIQLQKANDSLYYIQISNIPAQALGTPYVLTVMSPDNSSEYSLAYSAMSYVQKINSSNNTDKNLVELCNSLYEYFSCTWGRG